MDGAIKLDDRLYKFTTWCVRCLACTMGYPNASYELLCPIHKKFKFFTYSLGGIGQVARALYEGRMEVNESAADLFYKCLSCGGCGEVCAENDFADSMWFQHELRARCVEAGQAHFAATALIEGLKKEDNMLGEPKADRGKWAEGLGLKNITQEKAEVYFHAGCRYSYDRELWPALKASVSILQKAGVDFGIAGKDENCCGGRAYELGFQGEAIKYAENNMELLKTAGAKTVITACADGYYTFKVLYDILGKKGEVEVYHITEYVAKLIQEGRLKPQKSQEITVTYHDPCHLVRKVEPWLRNKTDAVIPIQEKIAKGENYEPPRSILKSIPGLNFVEMPRNRENSWCCGAGGAVYDTEPDFAAWTAMERISEAQGTGASELVTACPWCKRVFSDAVAENKIGLKVTDIVELLDRAL